MYTDNIWNSQDIGAGSSGLLFCDKVDLQTIRPCHTFYVQHFSNWDYHKSWRLSKFLPSICQQRQWKKWYSTKFCCNFVCSWENFCSLRRLNISWGKSKIMIEKYERSAAEERCFGSCFSSSLCIRNVDISRIFKLRTPGVPFRVCYQKTKPNCIMHIVTYSFSTIFPY